MACLERVKTWPLDLYYYYINRDYIDGATKRLLQKPMSCNSQFVLEKMVGLFRLGLKKQLVMFCELFDGLATV